MLEKTIRENIVLNKRLSGLVGNEMILFTENKLDDVKVYAGQRNQIEAERNDLFKKYLELKFGWTD